MLSAKAPHWTNNSVNAWLQPEVSRRLLAEIPPACVGRSEAQKGVWSMKRAASVRLRPTADQADLLRWTLETCNAACGWLADLARQTKTRRQYDLHQLG